MQIALRPGSPSAWESDALILSVEPEVRLGTIGQELDQQLDAMLASTLREARFRGETGKTLVIPTLGRLPARRIVAVGVGDPATRSAHDLRRAWGAAGRVARDAGAASIVSEAPAAAQIDVTTAFRSATEGLILAGYRFQQYRTREPQPDLDTVTFAADGDAAQRGITLGEQTAKAVALARDLGNQPPDALYPARLAEIAEDTAQQLGLECRVYDRAALAELGAGAILAVGQGSIHEPRLIHLTYRPAGPSRGTIGLIGKAITFDTGGINLKPTGSVETMKIDMAGGAAVLATLSALPALGLPITVHGVIASAENMPSGGAFRPSDVLRTLSGKTVEIVSTDAEGRLVLADALTYTARERPDAMIDLATLTGAAVVALGNQGTAVFGSDIPLVDDILAAAGTSGELMWQMPLWDAYHERLTGDVADLKNSGGRDGGSIFAALFLREFTEGIPWAHLDIAGPAWSDRVTDLTGKGATGHAVMTLIRLLESRSSRP